MDGTGGTPSNARTKGTIKTAVYPRDWLPPDPMQTGGASSGMTNPEQHYSPRVNYEYSVVYQPNRMEKVDILLNEVAAGGWRYVGSVKCYDDLQRPHNALIFERVKGDADNG